MEFDFSIFMIPILVAFCYALGSVVKSANWIDDNYIPVIVFLAGIILGVVSYFFGLDGFTPSTLVTAIVLGGISGWGATWVNQVKKQLSKGRDNHEELR